MYLKYQYLTITYSKTLVTFHNMNLGVAINLKVVTVLKEMVILIHMTVFSKLGSVKVYFAIESLPN